MPPLDPLPIDAVLGEISAALHRSSSLVIVAEPGAGKTTRVPPALLHRGAAIVLQPRRAAARAIARRIAAEQGWTVGQEVGWHVRFEPNYSSRTRLLIATEGMLNVRLQHDPLLSDFATIILDEFHERSVHTDLAVALARQATLARSDLRLVIMSATLDAAAIASYLDDCPVIEVPGRTYPIRIDYRTDVPTADAVLAMSHDTPGSILCFEPGAREIARTVDALRARPELAADVLALHGTLPSHEQDLALAAPTGRRRVIVCTNIAETSVTVPGVTGVVDTGLEKVARYDSSLAVDHLDTEAITDAAATQRAGRAGRTAPGTVYRLWERTSRLRPFREPEIQRVDLTGVVLDILGWGGDPLRFEWFDPPRQDAVTAALALLQRLGAVHERTLTPIGRRLLSIPLPPRLARVVVEADGHRDAVRAAVLLSERPGAARVNSSATTTLDLLAPLDRWNEVPAHLRELAARLERQNAPGGPSRRAPLDEASLRRAVFAGYPDRVGQRRARHSPRFLLASGTGAQQTADSGVRDAEYIVALDLQASTSSDTPESRVRRASAVDRAWLTPTTVDLELTLDDRGVVRAREVERYDVLRLTERPVAPDPEQAAALLAAGWLARPRTDEEVRWLNRLRFAGLEVDLATLARDAARWASSLAALDIREGLPHALRAQLTTLAPERLRVPSGRDATLDYEEDGTVSASVKLQELFGLGETPRLGNRKEPVLLKLLAPNGRPVQTTRDLHSFWTRTYPDVRKELRGRYPRHPWPDDPWTAPPTHRTRPRG